MDYFKSTSFDTWFDTSFDAWPNAGVVLEAPTFLSTSSMSVNFELKIGCTAFETTNELSIGSVITFGNFVECQTFQIRCSFSFGSVVEVQHVFSTSVQMYAGVSISTKNEFASENELSIGGIFLGQIVDSAPFQCLYDTSFIPCRCFHVQPFNIVTSFDIGRIATFLRGIKTYNGPLGDQSQTPVLNSFGILKSQKNILDLSPGAWAVQQLITKLCAGDPTGQVEIIKNKLVQEVLGHGMIKNIFSSETKDVQQLITKLCAGDPTGHTELMLNKLVQEVSGHEEIVNKISIGSQQTQTLQQTISEDGVMSIQNVLIDLLEKDTASGTQIVLQSMDDTQVHFHV